MVDSLPLGELLAALGMSGDRFARRLNTCAETLGRPERIHPKTPYKWIKGEVPRSPWRSLAALTLSQELGRQITVADLGWPPDDLEYVPSTAGLHAPWTPAGTLRVMQAVTDAGPMDRRNFLLLMGASVTSPAHEWLIAHPAGQITRAAGATVPAGVVDELDQIAARLRRMDDQVGGGQFLQLIHEHLRYVTSLLRERRYSDIVGRRLYATAAELLSLDPPVNDRPGVGNSKRDAPWPAMMGLSKASSRMISEASRKCNPLMPPRRSLRCSTRTT